MLLRRLRYWNADTAKFTRAPFKNLDQADIEHFRSILKK